MTFWAVVQSQPACERRAIAHIERQGFTHLCAAREDHSHLDVAARCTTRAGYSRAISLCGSRINGSACSRTIGVSTVLMNGDKPAKLPEEFVPIMKAREAIAV